MQKDDLPTDVNIGQLRYTSAIGDSMKPVLEDHSIIVVDKTKRTIVDGKMYLILEEGVIRVKILSYSKGNVKASAYSDTYCDENYSMSEFKKNKIIGQIILYSTKVD
nr:MULTISPECIES: S24 family peptidase [Vibrio]